MFWDDGTQKGFDETDREGKKKYEKKVKEENTEP